MRTRTDNSFMPGIERVQSGTESKTCPSDLISMALTALVFLFNSCVLEEDEDHHYKIYFENHWDKSIYIWYDVDWHWYDNPYENYFSYSEEPLHESESLPKILPGGIESELMTLRDYYEYALQDEDSVIIFVFDGEQSDKKDSECFLVRYHLSEEDLKKLGFHVCYPPTEAMKDFYMKPSYEEIIENRRTEIIDSVCNK